MRMRKNCTQDLDFELQSEMMSKMFRDKGYCNDFLEIERTKIKNVSREDLLKDNTINKGTSNDTGMCIVLDFNLQNKKVENIIHKY